jgi:hypothetical protein
MKTMCQKEQTTAKVHLSTSGWHFPALGTTALFFFGLRSLPDAGNGIFRSGIDATIAVDNKSH